MRNGTTKTTAGALALLGAVDLAFTWAVYPRLPAMFPIHWGKDGLPNGWGDKQWAAFLLPATVIALLLLHWATADRRRREPAPADAEVRAYCFLAVGCLFSVLQAIAIRTALHPGASEAVLLNSALFVSLAVIGNVLGKLQRNGLIGVRTPWTLADDAVWAATNRLAGRLMTAAGAFGAVAVWLGVAPALCWDVLLVSLIVPAAYSYRLARARGEGKG